MLNMRTWHGLTINANYTWSRAIDDGGTFRTGYAIPAGAICQHSSVRPIRPIASSAPSPLPTSRSTLSRLRFGPGRSAKPFWLKTRWSGQSWEASPSPGFTRLTPARHWPSHPRPARPIRPHSSLSFCPPSYNPSFLGTPARQNGKWGNGVTTANYTTHLLYRPSTGQRRNARSVHDPRPGFKLLRLQISDAPVPRRTTSPVPATTSSISHWCAASRCTLTENPPSSISVPSGTTSQTTPGSLLPAPRSATPTLDRSPPIPLPTARLLSSRLASVSESGFSHAIAQEAAA